MSLISQLQELLSLQYRIEREIGIGGMAIVYLAHDLRNERPVALKVLRPEVATAVGSERFLFEINITANLRHPRIVPLFDSGRAGQFLYYAMPFFEGETLREKLSRVGPLPIEEATQIAIAVAQALDYAHRQGVVHRDLKPENILLQDGETLLADFGIAFARRAVAGRLTMSGTSLGTPHYMSPEQATEGARIDGRSDIYSIGAVFYEMLTGHAPFQGGSAQAISAKKLAECPVSVSAFRDNVPLHIDTAITRALERVPADRFATAADFAHALSDPTRTHVGHGKSARSWLVATYTAFAIVLLAGGVYLATAQKSRLADADPNLVAIMPFDIRGDDELEHLQYGIVDLLTNKLAESVIHSEKVGSTGEPIQTVDASEIEKFIGPDGRADVSGPDVARHFKAAHFVLGSVLGNGDSLTITAALFRTDDPVKAAQQVSVVGSKADVFKLADELAAKLLVAQLRGTYLTAIAARTTSSLPALKAYMEAEQLFRVRRTSGAMAKYQRAIDEDSAFGLAWLGLSITSTSGRTHLTIPAATAALRHMRSLPPRAQEIIRIHYSAVTGQDSAETQLRRYLERYPSDTVMWHGFGDWLFHVSPSRGESVAHAREAFAKVDDLHPVIGRQYGHEFEVAVATGQWDEAKVWAKRRLARGGSIDTAWLGILAFVPPGQLSEQKVILDWLAATSDRAAISTFVTTWLIHAPANALQAAMPIVRRRLSEEVEPAAALSTALLLAGSGQLSRVHSLAASTSSLHSTSLLVQRALTATLPFITPDTAMLQTVLQELDNWDPSLHADQQVFTQSFVVDSLAHHVRSYLAGMVAVKLSNSDRLDRAIDELHRLATTPARRAVSRDFVSSLMAHAAFANKRATEALRLLSSSDREANARRYLAPFGYALGTSSLVPPLADRYIRGMALIELGRPNEAYWWFAGLQTLSARSFVPYAGIASLRRAQLSEQRGDRLEAMEHYARCLIIWQQADPPFAQLLMEARDGRRRLLADNR